jgi:ABC-type uncharacterized transport system substrate-binding protein
VLVIQSYTTDFSWSRDTDKAIRQAFEEKSYDIQYFYMDTKKHSDDNFKNIIGSQIRERINEWKPDAMIAVDDNAQSLVSSCYVNVEKLDLPPLELAKLKSSIPILGECYQEHPDMAMIYTGVGAEPSDYGFDNQQNIGGIMERFDTVTLTETLKLIKAAMNKETLNLVALVDNSTTSKYNVDNSFRTFSETLAPLNIKLTYKVASTITQWQENLREAEMEADMLLFTLYHTVKCGADRQAKRVSPKDLVQWTLNNTKLPAIGAWGFFVEDGGEFAVGVSPFEQGNVAAQMAIDYLDHNILPADIGIQQTKQSIIYMRENRNIKQKFELPSIYKDFALATNNLLPACLENSSSCSNSETNKIDWPQYCQ